MGILTIPSVIIAFMVFSKSSRIHLSKPHHIIGFLVLILTFVQIIAGRLRPGLPASPDEKPSRKRTQWRYFHSVLGILIYFLSIYEIVSGLQLYSKKMQVWNWSPVFAAWIALITCAIIYPKIR